MNEVTKFPKSGAFYANLQGLNGEYQVKITREDAKYLWESGVLNGDLTLTEQESGVYVFDKF